jgi:hypothetical protein
MLDVEKAYDTVWVRGLLYKLISFKFPVYLIKFLQSYLTDSDCFRIFFPLKNLSRPHSHRMQYSHRLFSPYIQATSHDPLPPYTISPVRSRHGDIHPVMTS